MFVTPESVDPYNAKTVRAGMGAHFRIPIRPFGLAEASLLRRSCALRVVADAGAATPYDRLDWGQPAALIIGSEASGPSQDLRDLATDTAAVPLAANTESLNAAVAGAILLFEAQRQRRARSGVGQDEGAAGPRRRH